MSIKHFVSLDDLSIDDLNKIIDNAMSLKKSYQSRDMNNQLQNKTLAMIFDKSSTRTRVSFEAGMTQLGGHAIFLSYRDIQLGRGETIEDSAKVISSMTDVILLRISDHNDIESFARHSYKPVINALSDKSHPCQMLGDIMTYNEIMGDIKGKTVTWIGDSNNMCQTYIEASKIFNFKLNISTPKNYKPKQEYFDKYKNTIEYFANPKDAAKNSDLIVTDVWQSMEKTFATSIDSQANKNKEISSAIESSKNPFKDFKVDNKIMSYAKPKALFMHCLPAYRGKEIDSEVIDGKQSVVFQEAENRLHIQKSILLFLLNKI